MEYHCFIWTGAAQSSFSSLDWVQNHLRGLLRRMIYFPPFSFFPHRRKVAGPSLFYRHLHGKCPDELYSLVPLIQTYTARTFRASHTHSNRPQFISIPNASRKWHPDSFFPPKDCYFVGHTPTWILTWTLQSSSVQGSIIIILIIFYSYFLLVHSYFHLAWVALEPCIAWTLVTKSFFVTFTFFFSNYKSIISFIKFATHHILPGRDISIFLLPTLRLWRYFTVVVNRTSILSFRFSSLDPSFHSTSSRPGREKLQ